MSGAATTTAPDALPDAAPGSAPHRTNHELLRSCARHFFELAPPAEGQRPDRGRWRCKRCGGEAGQASVTFYCVGLRHGRELAGLRHAHRRAEAAA